MEVLGPCDKPISQSDYTDTRLSQDHKVPQCGPAETFLHRGDRILREGEEEEEKEEKIKAMGMSGCFKTYI